jgi:hypothetical protein
MTTLILTNAQPLGIPNTGTGTDQGDTWDNAMAKVNAVFQQAGVGTVNFGAAPGAADASLTITGQTNIVAGSSVDAWIICTATADHSVDEHWVDPPDIKVGNIVPGVGFTIYAQCRGPAGGVDGGGQNSQTTGQTTCYGSWSVAWQWL